VILHAGCESSQIAAKQVASLALYEVGPRLGR
jgi:hypothetical protein